MGHGGPKRARSRKRRTEAKGSLQPTKSPLLGGTIVGAFAHSRVVASGFGLYGAAMSVCSHFLARGRDVVYPKDMSMMIGLGTREKQPVAAALPTKNPN